MKHWHAVAWGKPYYRIVMDMEVSTLKTKLMTNNTSGIVIDIKIKNQMVQTVQTFTYLGFIISDDSQSQKCWPE